MPPPDQTEADPLTDDDSTVLGQGLPPLHGGPGRYGLFRMRTMKKDSAFRAAFKVAVIYMILALLWIYISDRVVDLIPNVEMRSELQTFKGGLFVILSGLLILGLMWSTVREVYAARVAERKASSRLYGVLHSVGDCIWEYDMVTRQLMLDHRFPDLCGYPPHAAITPEQWRRLLHPSDLKSFDDAFLRCVKGIASTIDCSLRLHHSDGKWRTVRLRGSVIERDHQGRAMLLSGALSDITEYRENEARLSRLVDELSRSETELQRFSFATAHDLRTPLRQMVSYAQLARRTAPVLLSSQPEQDKQQAGEDLKAYLGFVADGANRMSTLLDSILENFEKRSRSLVLTEVDMLTVVDSVLEKLRSTISTSQAEIICEALPVVKADGPNLTLVMEHILRNALMYRDVNRRLKIVIGAERRVGSWEISVSDNGIGFPSDKADELFKAFFRLHAASEIPGSGMGLAMCRQIVQQHGGTLTARGRQGEGAVFYIELPDQVARKSPLSGGLDALDRAV